MISIAPWPIPKINICKETLVHISTLLSLNQPICTKRGCTHTIQQSINTVKLYKTKKLLKWALPLGNKLITTLKVESKSERKQHLQFYLKIIPLQSLLQKKSQWNTVQINSTFKRISTRICIQLQKKMKETTVQTCLDLKQRHMHIQHLFWV